MTKITYIKNGDYHIPNLKLKETENKPLGKYSRMRKDYLKNHRPALLNRLILRDMLSDHIFDIDDKANARFDALLPLYKIKAGIFPAFLHI